MSESKTTTVQEVKTLIDEQMRLANEFRETVSRELAEVKKIGVAMPETKAAIDAMNARFDAIEVKLKRPITGVEGDKQQKSAEYTAFEKLLKFGTKNNAAWDRFSDEEKAAYANIRQKALVNTTDFGGGNLVPEDFNATVIKKLANLAGVGSRVSTQATSRDVVRWPKVTYSTDNIDNSSLTLTWEDESDSATTTDPTPIGSVSIPVNRARGLVLLDRELLEDAAVDVMGLLSGLISDKVNVDTDRQLTAGTGGKKPEGFMINASIPTTNSGSSGAFLFDGLISLVYALPNQYVNGAEFMTSRTSMGLIRKLKDSQNRYLWEPSTQVGTPATLLGYPISGNEHIAAAAAASRSLIFANFKQMYMKVEKAGMAIQRLDEKYADSDQVGFIFRLRMGGGVIAPWAGQIQVLS